MIAKVINKFHFFILLCLLLGGCRTKPTTLNLPLSISNTWQVCQQVLENQGYKIIKFDPDKGNLRTTWKILLSPYERQGKRTAVELALRVSSSKLTQQLELRVISQQNYSHHDFMNAEKALWVVNGYDKSQEKLLISLVANKLFFHQNSQKQTVNQSE